ncbi:UNVERIFIED_CONTAM: hypothetical protein FKN15_067431 [Acipenser sinensis]
MNAFVNAPQKKRQPNLGRRFDVAQGLQSGTRADLYVRTQSSFRAGLRIT